MLNAKKKIFISYRRENAIDIAARVRDYFSAKGFDVFLDISSMRLGQFDKQLVQQINASDIFLLILSKNSLDRCADPEDWLRKEIECALRNKDIVIVPLMLPEFKFPQTLPESMKGIMYYHGIEYSAALFELVMDKLYQLITDQDASQTVTKAPSIPTSAKTPSKYYFKAIISESGGSLRIYSPDCLYDNEKYEIKIDDEMWNLFEAKCKGLLIAVFPGLKENEIVLRRTTKLGKLVCAPDDNYFHDVENTIYFDIAFIRRDIKKYDGAVLKIGDIYGQIEITLFKHGDFVFKSMPEDAGLTYFGIDENALRNAALLMLQFTTGDKNIIVADSFRKDIYPDGSGGFILNYISH